MMTMTIITKMMQMVMTKKDIMMATMIMKKTMMQ